MDSTRSVFTVKTERPLKPQDVRPHLVLLLTESSALQGLRTPLSQTFFPQGTRRPSMRPLHQFDWFIPPQWRRADPCLPALPDCPAEERAATAPSLWAQLIYAVAASFGGSCIAKNSYYELEEPYVKHMAPLIPGAKEKDVCRNGARWNS